MPFSDGNLRCRPVLDDLSEDRDMEQDAQRSSESRAAGMENKLQAPGHWLQTRRMEQGERNAEQMGSPESPSGSNCLNGLACGVLVQKAAWKHK
jgi:hypothetical protein